MIAIKRIKEGAKFADSDGTLFTLLKNYVAFDGYRDEWGNDVGQAVVVCQCERLSDKKKMKFHPLTKVILLEGEKLW